jgi:hypothetical protein
VEKAGFNHGSAFFVYFQISLQKIALDPSKISRWKRQAGFQVGLVFRKKDNFLKHAKSRFVRGLKQSEIFSLGKVQVLASCVLFLDAGAAQNRDRRFW